MLAALVQVVLPVVLVAAVGYVLARSFALDRQTLNKVGMHGLTPALAFTSIVKTEVSPGQGVWLVAGYVAANVLAGLVAWAVGGRWPGRTRRGVPDRAVRLSSLDQFAARFDGSNLPSVTNL